MKLPAYAKPLLNLRRAGTHPASVLVLYGTDWSAPEGRARLAVKPGAALDLDWRCVAGLPVLLIDRSGMELDDDSELFALGAQIAHEAAIVTLVTSEPLVSGSPRSGFYRIGISDYAFCSRTWDARAKRMAWPAWWTQELEQLHGQNRERWLAEIEAHSGRQAA